jgi:hypothetical protein
VRAWRTVSAAVCVRNQRCVWFGARGSSQQRVQCECAARVRRNGPECSGREGSRPAGPTLHSGLETLVVYPPLLGVIMRIGGSGGNVFKLRSPFFYLVFHSLFPWPLSGVWLAPLHFLRFAVPAAFVWGWALLMINDASLRYVCTCLLRSPWPLRLGSWSVACPPFPLRLSLWLCCVLRVRVSAFPVSDVF